MNTTAIYPNRIKDKAKLESTLGLPEFPELCTKGIPILRTKDNTLISKGYTRIVYGDHGPYIEFAKDTVAFDGFTFKKKSTYAWYDEWYSKDDTHTMLYDQKKGVEMLSNPPAGDHSHRGNRNGGYADYVVGMIYVDPYKCNIAYADPDLPNVPIACWGCTRDTMGDGDVCAECNPSAL
jgi:hypothetical protein